MSFIRDLFKKRIHASNTQAYKPKFKVGDYILNKKFKIVLRVREINLNLELNETGKNAQYKLINIKNDLTANQNFKYDVFKDCIKIDDYYDVIEEQTALVLYGKK